MLREELKLQSVKEELKILYGHTTSQELAAFLSYLICYPERISSDGIEDAFQTTGLEQTRITNDSMAIARWTAMLYVINMKMELLSEKCRILAEKLEHHLQGKKGELA